MKITNTFIGGKMNMDIDQRLLPKGQYFKALNIEVINSENESNNLAYGDSGTLRNSLGNKQPVSGTNATLNVTNISGAALVSPRCIGACVNNQSNSIYWLITSTYEDLIVEYLDTPNVIPTAGTAGTAGAISYIARAVKPTSTGSGKYFNFNINYPVTGINYFNGFLMWTDNLNPPRMINVNTFKTWTTPAVNFAWNQDDINVIVKPPLTAPTIYLYNSGTGINYIQDKFLYFSYRYKYTDGRWSSIAPFSKVAFVPSVFSYNAYLGYNTGMQNKYNIVNITVATGDRQVTDIQLLFKDSQFPNIYVIETINKAKPIISTSSIPNNSNWTYIRFDNSKIYSSLPSYQLTRLFDNVPTRALAQDIIGSRLIYGNYAQYYDMITQFNSKVIPNFFVQKHSSPIGINKVEPSLKSNRDYEFCLIYKDDYGRMSTAITSPTNTCHIYNSLESINLKNFVEISINHLPPYWATKYSIGVKQNIYGYYNIYPTLIVQDPNGPFSYYKLNSIDKNKIVEGEYIIIKSDYDGITYSNKEYKVLEVAYKTYGQIGQQGGYNPEGLYIKIARFAANTSPSLNIFSPIDSKSNYYSPSYSWINVNPLNGIDASPIVYYPYNATSLRLPYAVASYSRLQYVPKDVRIYIEYAGINSSGQQCLNYKQFGPNASNINGITPIPFRSSTGVPIPVDIKITPTSIVYGNLIISASASCNTGDSWRLNIYSKTHTSINGTTLSRMGVAFPVNTSTIGAFPAETIMAGATVNFGLIVDSKVIYPPPGGSGNYIPLSDTQPQSFVSSNQYVDIQEWFWEDEVYLLFNHLDGLGTSYSPSINSFSKNVIFRYGSSISTPPTAQVNAVLNSYVGGHVYMIIGSVIPTSLLISTSLMAIFSVVSGSAPSSGLSIVYQENILSIETVPKNSQDNVFHECTEDLSIYEDPFGRKKHSGNIQNQTNLLPAIISTEQSDDITITTNHSFNCWAFPNGVESDRIKDDFNAPTMEWSPRAVVPIEDYGEQIVSEGLTYSGAYKQDSNVNNLNQFNISLGNFKYLDKSFGSVQKIKSRNTDLVVLQQDKVSKVLFGKNLLSDSTGGGQVASIPEILGTQIAYQGEFGISNNPESFAQWDDNMFFTDSQRGAVLRLGNDGLFEISSNGMKAFFNTSFKSQPDTLKIGVFDPYYKRYILSETGFTKSQSLPSITVVNDPLDTLGSTFPLGDNGSVIMSASGYIFP